MGALVLLMEEGRRASRPWILKTWLLAARSQLVRTLMGKQVDPHTGVYPRVTRERRLSGCLSLKSLDWRKEPETAWKNKGSHSHTGTQ